VRRRGRAGPLACFTLIQGNFNEALALGTDTDECGSNLECIRDVLNAANKRQGRHG